MQAVSFIVKFFVAIYNCLDAGNCLILGVNRVRAGGCEGCSIHPGIVKRWREGVKRAFFFTAEWLSRHKFAANDTEGAFLINLIRNFHVHL